MISIIVCTYNRSESVHGTLQALQKQILPDGAAVEILVVDNNSRDRTKEVVTQFSEKSVFPLRYIFEENQGISFARNRAIFEARGDVLVFTDDDVIPSEEWIKNISLAFDQFDADIVGGPIHPLWESDPPRWLLNPEFQAHLALLDKGSETFVREGGDKCDFLYGANMAFKRNVFEKVGTFRTDLGNKGSRLILREDSEMLSRALRAGMKAVYVPSASVHHKVPSHKMDLRYLRRWRFVHGRSQVIVKGEFNKIPRWLVRECLGNALEAIWNYLRRDAKKALTHEKLFWFQAGMLTELIKGRLALKERLGKLYSWVVYHFLPPKKIVLIMSSMRSGSTLLKALLAEAEGVSHLPEIDYTKFGGNAYHVYRKAYFLSGKRIVVLKYPGATTKLSPKLDRIKIVVLVRDVYEVIQSLLRRHKDTELKHWTKTDWVKYWCQVYQRILTSVDSMNADVCFVRYEDLIRDPKMITKKLFSFLGSKTKTGVDHYQRPKNFDWEWGSDDGGEKIKKLQIVQERSPESDVELQNIIEDSEDAGLLREKFGYLNNNGTVEKIDQKGLS